MKTVTIGFIREDGDFQILATLNNKDDLIDDSEFEKCVNNLVAFLKEKTCEWIHIIEREDAPDYVSLV
jgi:hypothetical protein